MLVAGILGEACIGGKDNYINNGRIAISYVVSQVIYALHGFFFILFLGVEGLVKTYKLFRFTNFTTASVRAV